LAVGFDLVIEVNDAPADDVVAETADRDKWVEKCASGEFLEVSTFAPIGIKHGST
jgi:hypothetical protein